MSQDLSAIVPGVDITKVYLLPTPERNEIICRLYEAGIPSRAIAKQLGITAGTASGVITRAGLRRNTTPKAPKVTPPRPSNPKPVAPIVSKPSKAPAAVVPPKPVPEPKPVPVKRSGPVSFLAVAFFGQCKYPLWKGMERTGFVCGEPTEAPSMVYCSTHRSLCFTTTAAAALARSQKEKAAQA